MKSDAELIKRGDDMAVLPLASSKIHLKQIESLSNVLKLGFLALSPSSSLIPAATLTCNPSHSVHEGRSECSFN